MGRTVGADRSTVGGERTEGMRGVPNERSAAVVAQLAQIVFELAAVQLIGGHDDPMPVDWQSNDGFGAAEGDVDMEVPA